MNRKRPHQLAALAMLVGAILAPAAANGLSPRPIVPLADVAFTRYPPVGPVGTADPNRDRSSHVSVLVDHVSRPPAPTRPAITQPVPTPRIAKLPVRVQGPSTQGSSVSGKASWYCRAGVSACHHSYPPGSMVAAACGKLRRAMGSDWRGQLVTVKTADSQVVVKLVDYCASEDKLIDLYWEPMRRLGGTGVLSVRIYW